MPDTYISYAKKNDIEKKISVAPISYFDEAIFERTNNITPEFGRFKDWTAGYGKEEKSEQDLRAIALFESITGTPFSGDLTIPCSVPGYSYVLHLPASNDRYHNTNVYLRRVGLLDDLVGWLCIMPKMHDVPAADKFLQLYLLLRYDERFVWRVGNFIKGTPLFDRDRATEIWAELSSLTSLNSSNQPPRVEILTKSKDFDRGLYRLPLYTDIGVDFASRVVDYSELVEVDYVNQEIAVLYRMMADFAKGLFVKK